MLSLLRYRDLVTRGIVRNRPQLKRLQEQYGFPLGRMLSPNTRTWTDDEVDAWYGSRPTVEPAQWRGAARIKHEDKQAAEREAATAASKVTAE